MKHSIVMVCDSESLIEGINRLRTFNNEIKQIEQTLKTLIPLLREFAELRRLS